MLHDITRHQVASNQQQLLLAASQHIFKRIVTHCISVFTMNIYHSSNGTVAAAAAAANHVSRADEYGHNTDATVPSLVS